MSNQPDTPHDPQLEQEGCEGSASPDCCAFSPGQWDVASPYHGGRMNEGISIPVRHPLSGGRDLALILSGGPKGRNYGKTEIAANAHLIAAAPELFAALSILMDAVGLNETSHTGGLGRCERCRKTTIAPRVTVCRTCAGDQAKDALKQASLHNMNNKDKKISPKI